MSKDPKDMEDRPPMGATDDVPPTDRAMLLALSHRQRDSTPLSVDQERLLDRWMAERLPPIDADRAAELAKHNRFAAERVLERRLISAANEGPGVPSTLASRVLSAPRSPRTATPKLFDLRWPTLRGWQWSGLGAAVAATAVIAVFGFQFWQQQLQPDKSFQIAMVTIEDRSVLAEGVRRTRGPQRYLPSPPEAFGIGPPGADTSSSEKLAEGRFRDIDIPTGLLQRAIASAGNNKGVVEHSELMNYLRAQNDTFDNQARILIDAALADSLSEKSSQRNFIQVRAYDLDDKRTATIRGKIRPPQADGHFILLTLR
jgi:hypothetical protein